MDAVGRSTRERLLAVTEQLLVEGGVEGVSLREIARRAGVSHNAPLRHFPNLANLLAHVSAQGFGDLVDAIQAGVDATGPEASAVERLRAAGRGYCVFAVAHPGPFSLMFRFDLVDRSEPVLFERSHASFDQFAALVAAAQGDGWHRRGDTRLLAGALWSAMHGVATLWIDQAIQRPTGVEDLDRLLDQIMDLMVPKTGGKR